MEAAYSLRFDTNTQIRDNGRKAVDASLVSTDVVADSYLKTVPAFNLDRFLTRIDDKLGLAGTIVIDRPFDVTNLDAIPRRELEAATIDFGLRVVRRLNGRVFQFTRRPLFYFPYQTLKRPRSMAAYLTDYRVA